MAKPAQPRKPHGRPPTGLLPGERVSDYDKLVVRVPGPVKEKLVTLAAVTRQPAWRLVTAAIEQLWENAPDDDRRLAEKLTKRRSL